MRIEQLTFTRFIAALTVVFFHYGSHVFPANLPLLNPLFNAGPIAVSYFYVLSGFIMAIAYHAPDTHSPFQAQRYWLARIARIYPVYLLALLLMIAAKFHAAGQDPLTVLLSISMLQAWIPGYPLSLNAPGWSLSVEAFFYVCFPLLVMLTKRHQLRTLSIGTAVLWLVTQILHTTLLNSPAYQPFTALHDLIYYNPVMHLSTFLLGFISGATLQEGKWQRWRTPAFNHPALFGITLGIIGLLIMREPLIAATGLRFDYTNGLIAPLFAGFIVLLTLNESCLRSVLCHPWLVLLGEASFSLYILQKPLHGIYEKAVTHWIPADSAIHFYLFIVVLTASALASYWFFETPMRRFINNIVTRKR